MSDSLERVRAALRERFDVQRELGAGGMATVYLATDPKHGRPVAIKVLRPELSATLGGDRFVREIEIAARLQHPHILGLIDSGEAGGFLYYVMPFVEGESLRDRLRREHELPVDEAVRILREVADALSYAHDKGVVHRDIKPENVMLSGRHALVTDFGVAKAVRDATQAFKLTSAGVALGTPLYMAPEQATADPQTDHRADLYALGVMAYELIAGEPPFGGSTAEAVLAQHLTHRPVPVTERRPAVPAPLGDLIMRCLEKRPADRYQSADDVLQQLEQLSTPSGGTTPVGAPPSEGVSPRHRIRRRALITAGALAIVLIAAIALVRLHESAAAPVAGIGSDSVPSVGVLPFTELAPKPGQAYFADGLTEEVIGALSKIPGLRVPGRISSMHFKGSKTPLAAIAGSLHVHSILSASIQRDGNRVRIRADLVNAANGFELWSGTYDAQSQDLFAVYDHVARGIAGALRVKLGAAHAPAARAATSSAEAYNAYLLGRYDLDQRTAEDIDSALVAFARAIRADSSYALAWSGLADAYSLATPGEYDVAGIDADTALARSLAAGRRAVALDSTSAEAHTALASAYQALWDWDEAGREYRRALTLEPSYAPLYHFYGVYLAGLGRLNEALPEIRRAEQLEPLAAIYGDWVGLVLDAMGRREASVEQFDRIIRQHPTQARLYRDAASIALRNRDFERAGPLLLRELELLGDTAEGRRIASGLSASGTRRATALGLVDTTGRFGGFPFFGAIGPDVAMALGDSALAVAALKALPIRRGFWEGTYQRVFITNPDVRRTATYQQQLRTMGLQ